MDTPRDPNPAPAGTPDHGELLRGALEHDSRIGGAGRLQAPTPEELAASFPGIRILRLIGKGGMGAVYEAVQERLERHVALKILPRELGEQAEFGERFLREARALASLNHPHIVTVHDFGQTRDGLFFLLMEFVDGVNLRQLMELGRLSPEEALRITPTLCEALQYAHEKGVVHRDIKPENVLVDVDGRVKIADFGMAKLAGKEHDRIALTRSSAVFGTPQYMAPEQWRGSAAVDHRADIFSLGVVLYEMLTGELPIGTYDPPSRRSGTSPGLDEVVRRTLAQQPDERYQSAREVGSDVRRESQWVQPAARTSRRSPVPEAARPERQRRISKLPVVATLMIAGVVVFFFWILARSQQAEAIAADQNAQRAAAQATLEQAKAVVAMGKPFTGQLIAPLGSLGEIQPVALKVFVPGLLGVLVVATALGFWSLRRIRAAQGRLIGVPIAVLSAWVFPLFVATGLLTAISMQIADWFSPGSFDRGNEDFIGVVALLAGIAGSLFFLYHRARSEYAAIASGTQPLLGNTFHAVTTGAAVCLSLVLGAGATLIPRMEAAQSAATSADTQWIQEPRELLDCSVDEVLTRLGPPESMNVGGSVVEWNYRDLTGHLIEGALRVQDGRVQAYSNLAGPLVPRDREHGVPNLGDPVSSVVRRWGPPKEQTQGSMVTEMIFEDFEIITNDSGRVLGVERTRGR